MKEAILRQDPNSEFFTPERCFIIELSNSHEDPELSIAQARVKPGVTTRWHYLTNSAERYYIIQGKGSVEIGDIQAQEVNPGDVVIIPAMCPQRITNIGAEDLIFLALCTPRFSSDNYKEIEGDPVPD